MLIWHMSAKPNEEPNKGEDVESRRTRMLCHSGIDVLHILGHALSGPLEQRGLILH